MDSMFFDDWQSITRTVIITILTYVALIIMLRASGKRTLSKMNAFDFIVTVALGSTLAAVSLNKDVALADGILALFLLVFLQYAISSLAVRYDYIKGLITSSPSLLLYRGEMIIENMKKERITTEEIKAKARERGFSSLEDIDAIILETTGIITIVQKFDQKVETLNKVKFFEEKHKEHLD